MKLCWNKSHLAQLGVSDFYARLILLGIESGLHAQARRGACAGDQRHDHLVTGQWLAPPVARDVTEKPMLDLVPFARAWREVANAQRQSRPLGQALQRYLP